MSSREKTGGFSGYMLLIISLALLVGVIVIQALVGGE